MTDAAISSLFLQLSRIFLLTLLLLTWKFFLLGNESFQSMNFGLSQSHNFVFLSLLSGIFIRDFLVFKLSFKRSIMELVKLLLVFFVSILVVVSIYLLMLLLNLVNRFGSKDLFYFSVSSITTELPFVVGSVIADLLNCVHNLGVKVKQILLLLLILFFPLRVLHLHHFVLI